MQPSGTVAGLLALSATALLSQATLPTIRTSVRLVTVPTLVFSKEGRLVPGLEAGDFRLLDNGYPQQLTLDTLSAPVSVSIAVQANREVREYLSFIVKAGAVIESLLLGESGEAAIITYGDEVAVVKPFGTGDVQSTFRKIPASARDAHMLDAGWRGLMLLRERPVARARFLIFIGQPMDSGSAIRLASLKEAADRDNVTVFAIALPEFGKAFVSDNFALGPVPKSQRGGYLASVNLGVLIAALSRSGRAEAGADPFSILTSATGGRQVHIRKQKELEDAISAMGEQLRSAYQLSFSPNSPEVGYHTIKLEVSVPNATLFSRPGYWRVKE
ncbi:MAG: VWA domain-containing protein [Ignavibacteriota bacterium]